MVIKNEHFLSVEPWNHWMTGKKKWLGLHFFFEKKKYQGLLHDWFQILFRKKKLPPLWPRNHLGNLTQWLTQLRNSFVLTKWLWLAKRNAHFFDWKPQLTVVIGSYPDKTLKRLCLLPEKRLNQNHISIHKNMYHKKSFKISWNQF